MAVTAAGASVNVQQAMIALRQSVQMEQVASSLITQAAQQGANTVAQTEAQSGTSDGGTSDGGTSDGRGEEVDVNA
ncbi:MAG: hypothetical protein KAI27_03430 [Rhodospirillaceae bacterium]|nr:hypothetical protein [Rhodospirillaceae bacterium]